MIVRYVTYSLAGPFTQLVVADEVGPTGELLEGILDTSQGSPVLMANCLFDFNFAGTTVIHDSRAFAGRALGPNDKN